MKRKHKNAMLIGIPATVAAAVAIWVGTAGSAESVGPTPQPPWVRSDGSVDIAKVPERIGVAGPDGKPLLDKDGAPVTVGKDELFGPPPIAPGAAAKMSGDEPEHKIVKNAKGVSEEVVEDPGYIPGLGSE